MEAETTVEQEQLEPGWWYPKTDSGLTPMFVIPVHRGQDGRFITFRCENEHGTYINMARGVLEAYYQREPAEVSQ